MSKNSPSTPQAPDPYATAQAQGAANRETAIAQADLNRIAQYGPWGSQSYVQTGTSANGNPQYAQITALNPTTQAALGQQQQNQLDLTGLAANQIGKIAGNTANALDTSALPGITSYVQPNQIPQLGDLTGARDSTINAMYGQMKPMLDQRRNALENQLVNQGVQQGTEAWNNAHLQLNQADNQAMQNAVLAGNQEQQALFGLGLQGQAQQFGQGVTNANLGNAASQQALQQAISVRDLPINEYSALASGSQVQAPSFSNVPQVSVANNPISQYMQNAYQGQQNAYNQQIAANNSLQSGLFGLGGNAAMAYALL